MHSLTGPDAFAQATSSKSTFGGQIGSGIDPSMSKVRIVRNGPRRQAAVIRTGRHHGTADFTLNRPHPDSHAIELRLKLLRSILVELDQKAPRNRVACLSTLNQFLLQQVAEGNDVVLVIDEAQDLSDELLEEVRLLSNLETDQQKLLQIVLVGQPELRDKLNQRGLRQLRQRITVRIAEEQVRGLRAQIASLGV